MLTMSLALLVACGGDKVPDNIPVGDIAGKIDQAIDNTGDMVSIGDSYVIGMFGMDSSSYSEYMLKINAGQNVDEYGIFKGKDKAQTEKIAEAVKGYLKTRDEAWMVEYMPEERPKVQNAEALTVGNYVVYAILSDEDKSAAFDAFNEALK